MKVLTCQSPGDFVYSETTKPVRAKGQVLIRVKRIGICGTDIHAFGGTQPYFTYPRVLGHELSGELVEIDNEDEFTIGETVALMPYFACGKCIACRTGKPNCCVNMQVFGVHIDGGMAEYIIVPETALIHGEGINDEQLCLVEPLAIGAHGVRRANVTAGEYVLVMGAGPIGLAVAEFARLAGAHVIIADVSAFRLAFCKTQLGFEHCIDATADVVSKLQEITSGDMPTVVIDATGNLTAMNNGFAYMAHGARYVLVGLQREYISFSHPEFHKREATLMSSRNATKDDFAHVIKAIKEGKVQPAKYITHTTGFDELKENFSKWFVPGSTVVKAVVKMD